MKMRRRVHKAVPIKKSVSMGQNRTSCGKPFKVEQDQRPWNHTKHAGGNSIPRLGTTLLPGRWSDCSNNTSSLDAAFPFTFPTSPIERPELMSLMIAPTVALSTTTIHLHIAVTPGDEARPTSVEQTASTAETRQTLPAPPMLVRLPMCSTNNLRESDEKVRGGSFELRSRRARRKYLALGVGGVRLKLSHSQTDGGHRTSLSPKYDERAAIRSRLRDMEMAEQLAELEGEVGDDSQSQPFYTLAYDPCEQDELETGLAYDLRDIDFGYYGCDGYDDRYNHDDEEDNSENEEGCEADDFQARPSRHRRKFTVVGSPSNRRSKLLHDRVGGAQRRRRRDLTLSDRRDNCKLVAFRQAVEDLDGVRVVR